MAVVNDNSKSLVGMDESVIKSYRESNSDASALPDGESVNNWCVLKMSGNDNIDVDHSEKRKKRRRGKSKRKIPYNKERNESRKTGNRPKNRPRFAHRHADAPYNTNEFLMEDHNTFVTIPPPTGNETNSVSSRPARIRDPSFTSVDSDDDHFYSSPEDEEDFLTKEFSNIYRDLHVETLQGLSKSELIQHVLQLEEKVDLFEKGVGNRSKLNKDQSDESMHTVGNYTDEEGDTITITLEKLKQFQLEITRLRLENEKLQNENQRLQRRNRSSSVSSVDSESDSTSSSASSISDLSDKEELLETNKDAEITLNKDGPSVASDELNSFNAKP